MASVECYEVGATLPVSLVLTHSARKRGRLLRRMGVADDEPTGDASTTYVEGSKATDTVFVVWLSPDLDRSASADAGLLAHEATHVMQGYMSCIGEASPSPEFQAYVVGLVTQWLVERHYEWKRKRLDRRAERRDA